MDFNLADLFECVVDHVPERPAVACDDRRLGYRELDERASRVAHGLASLGVGTGDHVGLYLYNAIEHLEAMLGCYKLRAVPINVNYRYVADELAYLCDDADLVALLYHRELGPRVAALPAPPRVLIEVDDTSGAGGAPANARLYESVITLGTTQRDFGARSGDDLYILYTGGTTGMPKGVMWRQEDIFFAALGGGNPGGDPIAAPEEIGPALLANPNQRLERFLAPDDPGPGEFTSLSLGPLVHASGQWSALGTLLGGGKLVLLADRHIEMGRVLELVERERVGMVTLVGDASARPLLDALEAAPGAHDTSSLRLLGSGGSILSAEVKEGLLAAIPSLDAILEAIGSSESPAQAVALATREAPPADSLTFAAKDETMAVDDVLRPIEPGSGQVGRLATRGRVPLGYWNDPDRSATTFVEIDGDRWALPGDMATVDADGTIHFLGRGSQCINTGGEKVYPEEVEAVLKAHPGVADAVVVGAKDHRLGERVVAVVAPAGDADSVTLGALRAHCQDRLAGYKAPRALVVVDEVARSPAGKPDYRWAAERAGGPP